MCQARITTREFQIPGSSFVEPGTNTKAFLTGECQNPATKKVQVDEGDAIMNICDSCLTRWRLKAKKKEWYGWFDCDIPPDAPVYDSIWFWEQVITLYNKVNKSNVKRTEVSRSLLLQFLRKMDQEDKKREEEQNSKMSDDEQINQLAEAMNEMEVDELPTQRSQKEILDEQIAELKLWLDATKIKPQPQKLFQQKLKEMMNLQTQRKMLR
jgi:hypothetical protein